MAQHMNSSVIQKLLAILPGSPYTALGRIYFDGNRRDRILGEAPPLTPAALEAHSSNPLYCSFP